MNYAEIKSTDIANGPGVRVSLFVSGCTHHCKGCFNPETWDFQYGQPFDADVEERILRDLDHPFIEGLSLLGGEPFFQAEELAKVAYHARRLGWNVLTFSGYTYEYLTGSSAPHGAKELLEATDVLIHGPFVKEEYSLKRPLAGSDNQRFLFLTDRLSMEDFEENRFEVRIEKDGVVRVNGMGDLQKLMGALTGAPKLRQATYEET